MIYAIQAGDAGPIKFGVAKDVKRRMKELQTGSAERLRVLASSPVHDGNEALIHRHLEGDRMCGEWFRPTERALALVDAMNTRGGHCVVDHVYENDYDSIVWYRLRIGLPPHFQEDDEWRAVKAGRAELVRG